MRYFYDCEFLEDGKTIDLLSLGMKAADGRTLYLGNIEADWHRVAEHDWLRANVLPHLPGEYRRCHHEGTANVSGLDDCWQPVDQGDAFWQHRESIRDEVSEFIRAGGQRDDRAEHELWAYFGAYDHVALCQLFGRMIDLPAWVPMYTNDLVQAARVYGIDRLDRFVDRAKTSDQYEHHALADAVWDERAYEALKAHAEARGYYRRSPLDVEV